MKRFLLSMLLALLFSVAHCQTSICGITFGTSFESTKTALENKYGEPEYIDGKKSIMYRNISYSGIIFDVMLSVSNEQQLGVVI